MTNHLATAVVPGRVILHAGLHKTGTTTIQTALLRGGDFAYPMPERLGPGHADLAERTLGFGPYRNAADPDALTDAVHAMALAHGRTVPVVLSSEVFVAALQGGGRSTAFERLASAHPTELVLTLRPDHERLASWAAELVVGGATTSLDGYWLPALANATMKPRAVPRFLALAPWTAVHVVLIDAADPDHLFRAFEGILGARIARVTPQNTRWSALALMILAELNRTNPALDYIRRGQLALKAAHIVESDPETGAVGSLPAIPAAVLEELRERWAQDLAEIRSLHASGVIRLHERSSSAVTEGTHARTPPVARPTGSVVAVVPRHPTSTQRARLVLHVGPPKTGTSAFQVFLAQNPEALRQIGLTYPEGDGIAKAPDGGITSGNGKSIALHFDPMFSADPRGRFPHDATGRRALLEELRGFAQQSDLDQDERSVIISSEHFGVLSRAGVDDLATIVEAEFSGVRILSVLREPSELLGSIYAQRVKMHQEGPFKDFWDGIGRDVLVARLATPLRYADRFGDRSVRVIPYTPPEDGPLTLIRDLLVAASDAGSETVDLLLASDDVRAPRAVNRSPGPIGLEILRRGTANGMSRSLSARIATSLSETAPVSMPTEREVPADAIAEAIELCAPILAEIEQRFGVRPLPGRRPAKRSEQVGTSDLDECDAIARALIAAFDGPGRHGIRGEHRRPDPPPVNAARRAWVRRLRRNHRIHRMASLLPRRVRAQVNRALDLFQQ